MVSENGAVQGAPWRPDKRAGGEGVFLTNPGVLVTHARTPFPPAVGLRSCVRRMQVPSGLFASGRRRSSCGSESASRRSRGARLPRRRSCRQLRRRTLQAGTHMLCFCLRHAVWQGKNQLTRDVLGDKLLSNSNVKAS